MTPFETVFCYIVVTGAIALTINRLIHNARARRRPTETLPIPRPRNPARNTRRPRR